MLKVINNKDGSSGSFAKRLKAQGETVMIRDSVIASDLSQLKQHENKDKKKDNLMNIDFNSMYPKQAQ